MTFNGRYRVEAKDIDMSINTKGKRKLIFNDKVYYWYVKVEKDGSHRIHILAEDKKVNKVYPMFDTEVPVTPEYICKIIENNGI